MALRGQILELLQHTTLALAIPNPASTKQADTPASALARSNLTSTNDSHTAW
jgi:hypothetical protein